MDLIRKIRIALIAVIWASLFWSCQKEEDPPLPLTVTSVTPQNGAVDVRVNESIVVTFSRAISKVPASVANITVTKANGSIVSIESRVVSGDGLSVVLTPKGTLAPSTVHTISVKDVTTDDGVIVTPLTATFTTVTVPLKATAISPADGSKDLENVKQVVVTFDTKLEKTSDNLDKVVFGEYISNQFYFFGGLFITKSFSEDGLSVIINFAHPYLLDAGSTYVLQATNLVGENGAIGGAYSKFTIKDAPLAIVSFTPANGATDVALDSKVVAIFNKRMKSSVAPGFTVGPKNGELWISKFDGIKTMTFECTTALRSETTYGLIKYGDIVSAGGEKMEILPNYSFSTKK